MDRVTITLQNKDLIEEIINSSNELQIQVHNAIIDGITKRIVKNVLMTADDAINKAVASAKEESASKFMEKLGSCDWNPNWVLKEEYRQLITARVQKVWRDQLSSSVEKQTEKIIDSYKVRLESALGALLLEITNKTAHLNDIIQKSVENILKSKLSK